MRRSLLRRVAALALIAGVVAGVAVAIAVPRTTGDPAPSAGGRDVPRPPTPAERRQPRVAPALPQSRSLDDVRILRRGRPVVVARTRDSRGGPDWAVRVFPAIEVPPPHTTASRSRRLCAQVGRILGGRFGWIDATNTFRPAGFGFRGAPTTCDARSVERDREPYVEAFNPITDPRAGVAVPLQTVTWGLVGDEARLSLRIGDRATRAPLGRHGAFVVVTGPQDRPAAVTGLVRYPAGGPVRIGGRDGLPLVLRGGESSAGRRVSRPVRGAVPVIEARVPDPHGGLPFGLTATPAEEGGWCLASPGRIVGDRVGDVDYELGVLHERRALRECYRIVLTRRFWFAAGSTAVSHRTEYDLGADPEAGRVARRTLRGRIAMHGPVHADVRSVTIATPRDVRTLRPSPRAHVILVVYDGDFPTGETVVTARFRDGSTAREEIPLGRP
jgi:hypothetical protein